MRTIVVIGGGITGLSTMYNLQKLKRNVNEKIKLILVEANETLGGKIRSVQHGEFIMETGADSLVARKEGVVSFLDELGLHDEVVNNATGTSFLYQDQRLVEIPEDTVFGIPMTAEALFNSELISEEGKIAALEDFFSNNTTFTKESSVGEFLETFLGTEIVEKQIAPVLSGVYSGKLHELTLATTLPYLLDYKNKYGSIMRGLWENSEKFQSKDNKKFISFKNGLSTLIDRLEEKLSEVTILKGVKATKITKQQQGGYTISFTNYNNIEADDIILSIPHTVAQSLLQHEDLDRDFNQLVNSSLISVYVAFNLPDANLPKNGTGFIAPENSGLTCNACTWTSRKWTHTSENERLLLRLFYKNTDPHTFAHLNSLDDDELIKIALKDIEKSLGITGKPISTEITKWNDNMPKYHLKHGETIASLTDTLTAIYPNITLAGCSYYGVGIADCIMNGKETAKQVMEQITAK